MNRAPLAGKGIVVTRPVHQAGGLAAAIRSAGGRAILFPTIELREPDDPHAVLATVDRLQDFDFAVFVSPNAAARALELISARRAWPPALIAVAVGGGTARALSQYGVRALTPPHGRYDSEALLELPAFADPRGRRVVVFRGEGGRALLGDTLRERGAEVIYAECYRRVRPAGDGAVLIGHAQRDELHAITVTSSEGLRNLAALLGPDAANLLRETPLFAPHPRIAETARGLGVRVVVVTGAGDAGLLAGLTAYFARNDATR